MPKAKHRAPKPAFSFAYRGLHTRKTHGKKVVALVATLSAVFAPLVFLATQPASAYTIGSSFNLSDSNAAGFGVYIDAPQVQNSYVNAYPDTASSTQLETFNTAPTNDVGNGLRSGSCISSIAGGTVSGGCTIYGGAAEPDLGASTLSGDPAFGGNGSQFATANPSGTVIEFQTAQKYLGLWWAAGSPGNQIDFYSNDVLISSITTSNLDTLLGSPPASSVADGNVLTAIDGNSYQKNHYFGHPRGYTAAPPTSTLYGTNYVPGETYSYIHAFANGTTSFDKVVLSSSVNNGFEFDNFVTSTATNLQPIGRLVPYSFYAAQKIVRFDKNAADASGSMSPQTGLTSNNLNPQGFARPGYVFYGWNTAADGSGTWYSEMDHYSFAADVTLYAQWQAPSGKPVISGLGVRVNEETHTYSRPDVAHGLAINWMGQSPVAGDEYWMLCSNPHTEPGDYFRSSFPSDCVAHPYSAQVPVGNSTFPLSLLENGKYVGYGMWAQNGTGTTYAIQTAPVALNLQIVGLTSPSALTRSTYSVTGNPTQTSSGWYRCDNAFASDQALPSGTCVDVNSNSLSYTPVLADIGKYMIYKAQAEISGTSISATKVVSGGPAVVMSRFVDLVFGDMSVNLTNSNATAQLTPIPTHPDLTQIDGAWLVCTSAANSYVSGSMNSAAQQAQSNLVSGAGCSPVGALQGATSISVNSNYYGKYITYFYMGTQVSDNTQGLFVYRSALVPTPTPSPSPSPSSTSSASPSASSSPAPSASPAPSNSSSPTQGFAPGPIPVPLPGATSSPKPTPKPTPVASAAPVASGSSNSTIDAGSKKATITQSNGSVIATYPNGEIEPLQDVAIEPEAVTTLPKINIAGTKQADRLNIFAPVKNVNIGAMGDDGGATIPFAVLESPGSAKSFTKNLSQLFSLLAALTLGGIAVANANRKKNTNAMPGSADISSDPFSSSKKAWGDKLWIWNLRIAMALDNLSLSAVQKTAKVSPLLSRVFNDGSYLRAVFGPLTIAGPAIAAGLVIMGTINNGGLLANDAWFLLALVALIAFFDAFAGLVAVAIYAGMSWFSTTHLDVWQDLRVLIGTALVVLGPVMVMTAFRTIRRAAARKFSDWWERFVDLAVGPFISGWSATIFVSTLPAIAGVTLAIANHVLLIGVLTASAAFIRVLFEEFVARSYPQRLDRLTPDEMPEPSKVQKYTSLILRFVLWNFMLAGVLGNTWQLWVGSALILIPSVVSWYQEHIPNSPALWRLLPTGVPGLAFGLSVMSWTTAALSNLVLSSEQLARWAFAILPIPMVLIGLLAIMGRQGEHEFEIKPSKRNKTVYRLGGIAMLLITIRLAGVA